MTFKGYIDSAVETATATVTVATPFIEITSVVELAPPAPTPPTYQTVTFNVTPASYGGGQYVGKYYRDKPGSTKVGSIQSETSINGNRIWYCGWDAIDRVNSESWRDGSNFVFGLEGNHVTGKAWDENPFAGITVLGQDFFWLSIRKECHLVVIILSGNDRGGTTIPNSEPFK